MTPPPPACPPPPPSDVWRLLALAAVAAAVHGWLIANTAVTARDSVGFVRYALALDDPKPAHDANPDAPDSRAGVLRAEPHPPGYPLAVLAAATVVRAVKPELPITDQMTLSAQVASSVAGVLMVLPVFWLGRRLFDSGVGFWGALLLQLLPVFASDTSDGLSDGPFLLCVTTALALAVWTTDRPRAWPGLVACGAVAGLAYLVRPEGVLALLAVAAALVFQVVRRRCFLPRAVAGVLALGVGFVLAGGPYMAVIGGFTNKPSMLKSSPAAGPVAAVGGPLFAESIPADATGVKRAAAVATVTAKEWAKAAHYGVAVFAVIGFVVRFGRVWREPHFWPPVLYAGGQVAAVMVLGWKQGYVSERHLLPVTAVGTLFAVGGLPGWQQWWGRQTVRVPLLGPLFNWSGWPALTCAGLAVAGLVPVVTTRLHEDRTGHKLAGAELRRAIDALPDDQKSGAVVLDHYQWCQFFSERAAYAIPPDPPPAAQRVVFVVVELKVKDGVVEVENPDFGSERHKRAVDYFQAYRGTPHLEVVYHWPPTAPPTFPHAPPPAARMALAKITLPR